MMDQTQRRISDERLAELINLHMMYLRAGVRGERRRDHEDAADAYRELAALRASHKRLVELLNSVYGQVTNGRICYFGDHTGYEPQFSSEQTFRWLAALADARKLEGK